MSSVLVFLRSKHDYISERERKEFQTRFSRLRKNKLVSQYHSRSAVEKLHEMLLSGGEIKHHQSLLVLQCLGDTMFDEPLDTRRQLLRRIIADYRGAGLQFDILHYNEIMDAALDNKDIELFEETYRQLVQTNLVLNRVTFYILLRRYAEEGNVDKQKEILSAMRAKESSEVSINRKVLHLLIRGFSFAKNSSGVAEMLSLMRSLHLDPTSETHEEVVNALVRMGQPEKADEYLSKNGRRVSDECLFRVMECCASHDHSGLVEKAMSLLQRRNRVEFNKQCVRACVHLLRGGHLDLALELRHRLFPSEESYGVVDEADKGAFLVRAAIKLSMAAPVVSTVCRRLQPENGWIWEKALVYALQYSNTDCAVHLLREMHTLARPLRPHYWWPIWASAARRGDVQLVYSSLSLMLSLDVPPDGETVQHYLLYYLLYPLAQTPLHVMHQLERVGLAHALFVSELLGHALGKSRLEDAVHIVRGSDVRLSAGPLRSELCKAADRFQRASSVAALYAEMLRLLRGRLPDDELQALSDDVELALKRDPRASERHALERHMHSSTGGDAHRAQPSPIPNRTSLIRRILEESHTNPKTDAVLGLVEQYHESGYEWTPHLLAVIMDLHLRRTGDLDAALYYYKQLRARFGHFRIKDVFKLSRLLSALVLSDALSTASRVLDDSPWFGEELRQYSAAGEANAARIRALWRKAATHLRDKGERPDAHDLLRRLHELGLVNMEL